MEIFYGVCITIISGAVAIVILFMVALFAVIAIKEIKAIIKK